MARDPSVIMMGEDIAGGAGGNGEMDAWGGVLGVTKGLYAKHGDRLHGHPHRARAPSSARPSARPPAACARWPS